MPDMRRKFGEHQPGLLPNPGEGLQAMVQLHQHANRAGSGACARARVADAKAVMIGTALSHVVFIDSPR